VMVNDSQADDYKLHFERNTGLSLPTTNCNHILV